MDLHLLHWDQVHNTREVVTEGAYTVETGMELKTLVNMETNTVLLLRD